MPAGELQAGSEYIDKGVAIDVDDYAKDIYGNDRIMGKSIDIGASEFNTTTAIAPIVPGKEVLNYGYYSISGQYLGTIFPSVSGIYIVKITDNNKTVITKKIVVK